MIAAEASLSHARSPGMSVPGRYPLRIAELTSGSGLIGLHLLRIERNSTLLGLDLDASATAVAGRNAEALALTRRTRFTRADLKSRTRASGRSSSPAASFIRGFRFSMHFTSIAGTRSSHA
jgi:methylase of polypeptide subunit release factors